MEEMLSRQDTVLVSYSDTIKHLPIKRIFDLIFSSIILLLALPFLIIIALSIRAFSSGKVIYYHERIGRGGTPFRCYKFRTMYADADQRLEEILQSNPNMRKEWEENFKLKNDPRVTPIGAFLRKTSLDEFPQFWNVLKGDLSVVGPRPVVKEEVTKHFGLKAYKILSIRPGITGLWQISGRSNTTYAERVSMDEHYVDARNFWFDLKVIAMTLPCIFLRKGAY